MAPPATGRNHLGLVQLLMVTCPALGLQIFWSTIASQLAPFLRENGLPNYAIAGTLLTQPLAGAILSPLLGAVMDLSHHPWGRRTPMILTGILAVLTLLGALIFSLSWTGSDREQIKVGAIKDTVVHPIVQAAIILLVVGLGCAVQPLQIGLRCLVVDQTPSHQHGIVGAWVTFLTGAGAIITFFFGSLDLHLSRSTAFRSSFLGLALIAACSLIATVGVALVYAKEWTHGPGRYVECQSSCAKLLGHLRTTSEKLSRSSKVVYSIQAWAWMVWFPFLFYTTTFISELSLHEDQQFSIGMRASSTEKAHASLQLGSLASLASSVISLLSSAIIPALVVFHSRNKPDRQHTDGTGENTTKFRLWAFSEACTAVMMFSAVLATTSLQGIAIIALLGVTWSIGQWVPFAIMSSEVDGRDSSQIDLDSDGTERAGATLGLYNTAISGPQILVSLLGMLVYAVANVAGSAVPTAWVLAISGCAALRSSMIAYKEACRYPLSVA